MKAPESADCPKFLDALERLVDGHMKPKEEKDFLASISLNVDCIEKLEIERSYKEFLATKIDRKCCSQKLLNIIQDCTKEDV